MITLNEDVKFNDKVRPICLPTEETENYVGRDVTVAGWGSTGDNGIHGAVFLNQVDLTITTDEECKVWEDIFGTGKLENQTFKMSK